MLQLSTIYEPIQQGLQEVEETIKSFTRPDMPWMAGLLGSTLSAAGKRIRPAVTLLAGQGDGHPGKLVVAMATAVELFHTATLVHDDIVDKAAVRRGKPTVSHLHGEGVAVLLGDYLFARSAELVASTENIRVIRLFAQTLSTISSGELRHSFTPYLQRRTRQHYFQWIASKTAALFALATESGAVLGGAPEPAAEALRDYGENLGRSYQIVDDILDFVGEEEELGKAVGADLMQGAITLPIILLAERYPEDEGLRRALQGKDGDAGLKRAIALISASSIMDECYAMAQSFSQEAQKALESLPPTPHRHALQDLAEYVLHRKK